MKRILLLILITALAASFSNGVYKIMSPMVQKSKVLLIQYYEHTECEVIKDANQTRNKYSKFCGELFAEIDDFSSYDSINGIFYVENNIYVGHNSKIVFWEYGNIRDIFLPFKYSRIFIDTLLNDSTIGFHFDEKKMILKKGQEIVDTTIRFEEVSGRTTKYTTIINVKNHGLLYRNNIILNEGRIEREQKIKDSLDIEELKKGETKK